MIEWWGPVIHEYWASTEAAGATIIGPQDALERPGSVGKALLGISICDDAGAELPTGDVGLVFIERDFVPFQYHNDPVRPARPSIPSSTKPGPPQVISATSTRTDSLYLTDRKGVHHHLRRSTSIRRRRRTSPSAIRRCTTSR